MKTTITIKHDSVKVEGHTRPDICNAISTAFFFATHSAYGDEVTDLTTIKEHPTHPVFEFKVRNGDVYAQNAYNTIVWFVKQLAVQYQGFVSLVDERGQ